MSQTMNVKIVLNNYKREDGRCMVLLQVIIDRKRVAINTGIKVPPYLFHKPSGKIKEGGQITKQIAKDYNLILEKDLAKANEIFVRARLSEMQLTKEIFKDLFNDNDKSFNIDFLTFMKQEIERLEGSRESSSIETYTRTLVKLSYFSTPLLFNKMNGSLIEDFDRFMIRDGLSPNTRALYHKVFKSFINYAIKRDIKVVNPYIHFPIKRMKGNREFLDANDLVLLREMYESNELNRELQEVLEYFLFSCYTGLRISDIQILSSESIISNILVFTPVKTKNLRKVLKIPLPNYALNIIKGRQGKLFKTITNQATNRALKDIAECAVINKNLTFHVARHTFATTFLRVGGSVEVLQKLLGHSKIETTMEYVHIMEETLVDQMDNFNNI